jgi:hypothetical protein
MNNNFEEMDKYLKDEEVNSLRKLPNRLDFCHIIYTDNFTEDTHVGKMPARPKPLIGDSFLGDLSRFHVAKLERVPNTYRLYFYNKNAKGVFRGEHQQLVCESIPFDDEWTKFVGLLIYDDTAYEHAKKDWKNYWEWKKNRNEARYRSQEAGTIDYDAKNMLHCVRLLWSGKNILLHGEPIVRFEGKQREFLLDIRRGKFTHSELMELMEKEMAEMLDIKNSSTIPDSVDQKAINSLYKEIIGV